MGFITRFVVATLAIALLGVVLIAQAAAQEPSGTITGPVDSASAGTLLVFGQDTCSAESPAILLRSEEGATIIEGELFVEGPSEGKE